MSFLNAKENKYVYRVQSDCLFCCVFHDIQARTNKCLNKYMIDAFKVSEHFYIDFSFFNLIGVNAVFHLTAFKLNKLALS